MRHELEPWLRGAIPNAGPLLAPVFHALQQAREDLTLHTEGLSAEQIWSRPHGLPPLGFHLRHIAGSLDRLTTYLLDRQLSPEQMAFLSAEHNAGSGRAELLRGVDEAIHASLAAMGQLQPEHFAHARFVGRKRLPTTAIGLAVHMAEHTQRHVGQAITTGKLLRAIALSGPAANQPECGDA